jgi:drug/metabolite transporter (DMT)-like permease
MIAVLLGVFAALSWSLHDVVARSFAARIGPVRMAIAVMVFGGVFVSAVVLYRGHIWQADRAGIISGLVLGVAYGMGVGGLFKAFSLGPISLVGPVTATYPVLAVLWNVAMGLAPSPIQWLSVAAALTGAMIVARTGHADGGINSVPKKDVVPLFFFCLVASIGYSASIILGQKAGLNIGEYEATFVSRFTGTLVLLPFLLGEVKPMPLQARHWLGLTVMALLDVAGVTAVNLSGFMPGHEFAGIGISAYGGIAVILAAVFLKEKVSHGQWFGIFLVVGGVTALAFG